MIQSSRTWVYVTAATSGAKLQGEIRNRKGFKFGECITTQDIVSLDGRFVTTKSGALYELGEVHPAYRRWLRYKECPYAFHAPLYHPTNRTAAAHNVRLGKNKGRKKVLRWNCWDCNRAGSCYLHHRRNHPDIKQPIRCTCGSSNYLVLSYRQDGRIR